VATMNSGGSSLPSLRWSVLAIWSLEAPVTVKDCAQARIPMLHYYPIGSRENRCTTTQPTTVPSNNRGKARTNKRKETLSSPPIIYLRVGQPPKIPPFALYSSTPLLPPPLHSPRRSKHPTPLLIPINHKPILQNTLRSVRRIHRNSSKLSISVRNILDQQILVVELPICPNRQIELIQWRA